MPKVKIRKECIYCPHPFECLVNEGEVSKYGVCPVCERKLKDDPDSRRLLELTALRDDPRRI